ncbi:MAG: hypothetical protein JWN46_2596 [Acidimicrobiales bacterium]|nr:hypothetical protein [Acidimicrobiales bacterium]
MPSASTTVTPTGLTCSPAGLLTAILLLDGPLDASPLAPLVARELADLAAAGAIKGGALRPWAADLVAVAALPDLTVTVVVEGPDPARRFAVAWAHAGRAVLAVARPDGALRLSPVEVAGLHRTMLDIVELPVAVPDAPPGVLPDAPPDAPDAPAVARLLSCLLVDDEAAARAALADIVDLRGVAALLAAPPRIIRVEVAPARGERSPGASPKPLAAVPGSGSAGGSLTLLDAGPLGLWRIEVSATERHPRLHAIAPAAAAQALADLLAPQRAAAPTSPTPAPPAQGAMPCPPSSPPIPSRSTSSTTAPSSSASG